MSTHNIDSTVNIQTLRELLAKYLKEPTGVIYGNGAGARPTALEFTPDLDGTETANLDRIFGLASRGEIGLTEEQVIRDERATLVAYLANASPSAAQTVTALKSLIRVVRALARE